MASIPAAGHTSHEHGEDAIGQSVLYLHRTDMFYGCADLAPPAEGTDRRDPASLLPAVEVPPLLMFGHNNQLEYEVVCPVIGTFRNASWDLHGGSGPTEDLRFATSIIEGYWYMTPEAAEGTDLGAFPLATVRMDLWAGEFGGKPLLVASGRSSTANAVALPGIEPVYEFRVPMEVLVDVVESRGHDGRMHLQVSIEQVEAGSASFTQSGWSVREAAGHPPRLVFPHFEPLVTKEVVILPTGDGMRIRWSVNSVWSAWDVDTGTAHLDVERVGDGRALGVQLERVSQSVSHDDQDRPVVFDWQAGAAGDLAPGEYVVTASVENLQRSFRLTMTDGFTVDDEGTVDNDTLEEATPIAVASPVSISKFEGTATPGPGVFLAAAGVSLAIVGLRRRT
jgi:hypothetical protein